MATGILDTTGPCDMSHGTSGLVSVIGSYSDAL